MFIKTLPPETLIGTRCYPRGSIVEVDEVLGKAHVAAFAAVPSDGPAREPDPDAVSLLIVPGATEPISTEPTILDPTEGDAEPTRRPGKSRH